MSIFQIIAICFALFMIYVVRVKSKKYKLSRLESWGWSLIWVVFAILSIFPNLLLGVVHTLNFGRVFDLLVVGALMVLTTIVFFLYFTVKGLQKKLEEFVRSEAMKDSSK